MEYLQTNRLNAFFFLFFIKMKKNNMENIQKLIVYCVVLEIVEISFVFVDDRNVGFKIDSWCALLIWGFSDFWKSFMTQKKKKITKNNKYVRTQDVEMAINDEIRNIVSACVWIQNGINACTYAFVLIQFFSFFFYILFALCYSFMACGSCIYRGHMRVYKCVFIACTMDEKQSQSYCVCGTHHKKKHNNNNNT